MTYSAGDLALIQHYVSKGWGYKKIYKQFKDAKPWTQDGLKTRVSQIKKRGEMGRKPGSGRPRTKETVSGVGAALSFIRKVHINPSGLAALKFATRVLRS